MVDRTAARTIVQLYINKNTLRAFELRGETYVRQYIYALLFCFKAQAAYFTAGLWVYN